MCVGFGLRGRPVRDPDLDSPLKECAAPALFGPAGRPPGLQCTRIRKDVYLCVYAHLCVLAFAVSRGVIAAAA